MLNAIGKPVDEAELVRRCKKADHKAQEELYASYSNRMFRVAFRYIKSQVDTEDIMMVTFTKVFAGMRDLKKSDLAQNPMGKSGHLPSNQ